MSLLNNNAIYLEYLGEGPTGTPCNRAKKVKVGNGKVTLFVTPRRKLSLRMIPKKVSNPLGGRGFPRLYFTRTINPTVNAVPVGMLPVVVHRTWVTQKS